jgi:Fic family protein
MGYEPKFRITPETLRWVAQASELRAWISMAVVDVPWLAVLQRDTAARLAHSSTSIEGNPLTLPEVDALARGENIGTDRRASLEVLNALATLRWIWKRPRQTQIQEKDILRLHALLTTKLLPDKAVGAYKTVPNRVVDHRGKPVYIPPGPKEVSGLTRDLLAWLNSDAAFRLHAVIASAIAHHRLVSIHPVSDGNGRLARALGVWVLCSRGFDTLHLFALDDYFSADRPSYYLKIQQARDWDDDLTDWVEYVAQGVVTTLGQTVERIRSLQVRNAASKIALTKRQEDVLRFMRDRGTITSSDLQAAFKFTRARAGQILKPLVSAGLVEVVGRQRSARYRLAK